MGRRLPLRWLSAAGGGSGRGWRRASLILALVFCSPLLVLLACLSLPLLCIAGLCLRLGRQKLSEVAAVFGRFAEGDDPAAEGRLLHRYLEDQLGLVREDSDWPGAAVETEIKVV